MKHFEDLQTEKDVKGGTSAPGSPRTPNPIPVSDLDLPPDDRTAMVIHQNGTFYKVAAGSAISLLAGMAVAWFTAIQERGVTRVEMETYIREARSDMEQHIKDSIPRYTTHQEMEDYVAKYTPWSFDKQTIITRLATQDQQIGELRTKIDQAADIIKGQHEVLKR